MKLFKNDQQWEIYLDTEHNIVRKYGKIDGRQTTNIRKVTQKNIGKSNETSIEEQANKEMLALISKQKDLGYGEYGHSNISHKPMLAHNYDLRKKGIKFPCHVQPKLDGVRLIAIVDPETGVKFLSRTGKEVKGLEHIKKDLLGIKTKVILDGEAYIHDTPFEEICSAFKSDLNSLEYHVFDIIDVEKSFTERQKILDTVIRSLRHTKNVITQICELPKDVDDKHGSFLELGYEGIMIRNSESMYAVDKRSVDLQKFKLFKDAEYKVVNIIEAFGDPGTALFVCETGEYTFNVRPRGTREHRKALLENKNDSIGKFLTVRYQNLTENGIPRFPVGLVIRDYE